VEVTDLVQQLTDGTVEELDLTCEHFLRAECLLVHRFALVVDKVFPLKILEVKLKARRLARNYYLVVFKRVDILPCLKHLAGRRGLALSQGPSGPFLAVYE
jgi:hypothetical protein